MDICQEAERMGALIHTHAIQTIFQKIYPLKFFGQTLIEYMNDLGLLGKNVVIGHCVYPTESDIQLLAKTGTGVTHHPSCNLRVRNGIAPAYHMMRAGVRVVSLYSLEEVFLLLKEPYPQIDVAQLEKWIRTIIHDGELADRINTVIRQETGDQDTLHAIRDLVAWRLIQCKQVTG